MKSVIPIVSVMFFLCLLSGPTLQGQKVTEPFEFQFEQKTLRGLIEQPRDGNSAALVIIIPGYGQTDFVEGRWYAALRNHLVKAGLSVCFWDKMGCGESDGEFDAQQPVQHSAKEAIAAIQELKKRGTPGSDKIGLWGISRAGWICPLINEQFPIDFWISVSGTDDKENYGYLLYSNLIIAGKAEAEAERLFDAWMLGHQLTCSGSSYEQYLSAIRPLMQDSTCRKLFGYPEESTLTAEDRKYYLKNQESYTSTGHFDTKSGLWVYLEDFDEILLKIKAPVLALFGANDSQVDWRKTKQLYEETIGQQPGADLTTKVFQNCNHNLQQCITCAYQEDLTSSRWQACDDYYDTMIAWLKLRKIIE